MVDLEDEEEYYSGAVVASSCHGLHRLAEQRRRIPKCDGNCNVAAINTRCIGMFVMIVAESICRFGG